jgi:hypothetical protein
MRQRGDHRTERTDFCCAFVTRRQVGFELQALFGAQDTEGVSSRPFPQFVVIA